MFRRAAFALLAASMALAAGVAGLRAEPVGPALTPKLRDALRAEMVEVMAASQEILAALMSGNHATVAERAQRIHDSFILEQALSPQDLEALEAAFHETAADLALVARAADPAREAAVFGAMVGNCVACHTRFAADRFPGLEPL